MNKTTSRILALTLALVLAAALLSGCGAGPEGFYRLTSLSGFDLTNLDIVRALTLDPEMDMDTFIEEHHLELLSGGKVLWVMTEYDTDEGKYTVKDGEITFNFHGYKVNAQLDGNTITLEHNNRTYVFEKM